MSILFPVVDSFVMDQPDPLHTTDLLMLSYKSEAQIGKSGYFFSPLKYPSLCSLSTSFIFSLRK